jgi:hypothetical protein
VSRPHIEFIDAFAQPQRAVASGPFAGASAQILSEDADTGASTALVSLPAGWSGDLAANTQPSELLVLSGAVELEDQPRPLTPGMYLFGPGGGAGRLRSRKAALVFAMQDEPRPEQDGEPTTVDPETMRWSALGADSGTPPGIVFKRLRLDPDTGDWTYLLSVAPGWQDNQAEVHPTIQEGFVLRGDCLLGTRGVMRPGSYFWRPSMVPHGPIFTHYGSLYLFRTKGGSWEVSYQAVPGWQELIVGYARELTFFVPPES